MAIKHYVIFIILESISCLIMNLNLLYCAIHSSVGFPFPISFQVSAPTFYSLFLHALEIVTFVISIIASLILTFELDTDSPVTLGKSPPLCPSISHHSWSWPWMGGSTEPEEALVCLPLSWFPNLRKETNNSCLVSCKQLREHLGRCPRHLHTWAKGSFHLSLLFSPPVQKVHLCFPRYLSWCARPGPFFHSLPYFPSPILKTIPLLNLAHTLSHLGNLCHRCV